MALATLHSAAFLGLDALAVEVEVDVGPAENFAFVIVGLPDTVVRESKDRVMGSILNSGYKIEGQRITVNLAPGDIKKEGALYDLPMALGMLQSMGLLKAQDLKDYLVVGELGLSGQTRPIHGALSIAMLAKALGKVGLILPKANAEEAAHVPHLVVLGVSNLKEAVLVAASPGSVPGAAPPKPTFSAAQHSVDMADVKGQHQAKRALEVAASGGHNLLMSGPPGSGKSMLSKALPGILPPLTVDEALETTKIYSMAKMLKEGESLVSTRPFRSPHHTVSFAGLIGGGSNPKPGEVALAHNGVLFLDELPEFSRMTLEVLRQPLEDGHVTISRAGGHITFPTRFVCVAAMNPCPCGMRGHPEKACTCSPMQVLRYRGRISGPLLDRFDLHVDVQALKYEDFSSKRGGESSATVRERVMAARNLQLSRQGKVNAGLSASELKLHCQLTADSQEQMRRAIDVMGISARAHDRILRVARTLADLEASPTIQEEHIMEAISFRGANNQELVPC